MTRNIVYGVFNIPKRYPTIINAHANKKKCERFGHKLILSETHTQPTLKV